MNIKKMKDLGTFSIQAHKGLSTHKLPEIILSKILISQVPLRTC